MELQGTSLTREDFDFDKNNWEAAYEVGEEAGMTKGKKIGHKIGQQSALKETAKNLLKYGMSVEDIALNTHLSIKEINKLKYPSKKSCIFV